MANSNESTANRPPEERRKDSIKVLRRAQLFIVPVCIASTVVCTQSIGAFVKLPKIPPEGWIAVTCMMIATSVGPIEIMITESKLSWEELPAQKRLERRLRTYLTVFVATFGMLFLTAFAVGKPPTIDLIGNGLFSLALIAASGFLFVRMMESPIKLLRNRTVHILVASILILIISSCAVQFPCVLVLAACAFVVSPMVLTLKYPRFTFEDTSIRLLSSLCLFVLPIAALTAAFGFSWHSTLPLLLLQTAILVLSPIMTPKSLRDRPQDIHA